MLFPCIRWTSHRQFTHRFLLGGGETVEAVVNERSKEAPTAGGGEPVGLTTKLDVEIEDPGGHRPTKSKVAPQFGRCVIGDEQSRLIGRIRRLLEFRSLEQHGVALVTTEFAEHEADRHRLFAVRCPEFEVDEDDAFELSPPIHSSPRSLRTTGWSGLSM